MVVTVLERQSRVGGRALTLRSFFSLGLVPQAGPARFLGNFTRVAAFAEQCGLETADFYPSKGRIAAYLGGIRMDDYPVFGDFWGYDVPKGFAPRAIRAARRMLARLLRREHRETFRLRSGTDSLTNALAAATTADFRLGATVRAVAQDENEVRVTFTTERGDESLAVDYVVCAVPLSILPDIEFTPPLSSAKSEAAKSIPFASAMRIFLEMRQPYWRGQGFNGFAVTDTIGEVWDVDFEAPNGPTLLVCYAREALADRLSHLSPEARIDYAIAELEHVFPGARKNFVRGTSFSWREQPWIRGGWPLVRNGFEHMIDAMREPHLRLVFAGDYNASPDLLNVTEGAIESAERAVEQVKSLARGAV